MSTAGGEGVLWRGAALGLLVAALLLAFNMRSALVAVAPVMDQIRAEYMLSATQAALLTAIPILSFAALAPLAPRLSRRYRTETVLFYCAALIGLGELLRIVPGFTPMMAGTLALGGAIAVANVLLPGLVKHHFATRVGLVTGLYLVAMNGGASLAAYATAYWVEAGAGWRVPLGMLAVPALVAALAWGSRLRVARTAQPEPVVGAGLWRDWLTWQVTAYFGLQSVGFYSMITWLPSMLADAGLDASAAGGQLALLTLAGIPAALLTPLLAVRFSDQRLLAVGVALFTAAGFAALAVFPLSAPTLWSLVIGLGLGAAFSLAITLIVLRSRDPRQAASLSSIAQSGGYLLAAASPLLVGVLADLRGSWNLALWLLAGSAVAQSLFGLFAGRARYVGPEPVAGKLRETAEWAAIAATHEADEAGAGTRPPASP